MSQRQQRTPMFAVVGQVNRGKSSIIATLAEDDSVAISPRPGTTTEARAFPVRIDGQTLFTLVDTPGFEEAAYVLEWLRETEPSAAERPARIRAFLDAFANTTEFPSERRLLAPVVAGSAVLYVVDGAQPYKKLFEPEMEILRWTGRPVIALINRKGDEDYADEWRAALKQYFQVVRDFNAHTASFDERVRLLSTFRALNDQWAPELEHAIEALTADWARRREDAVDRVTELLMEALTFTLSANVHDQAALDAQKTDLASRFHEGLRDMERRARRDIERLYHHTAPFSGPEVARPVFDEDLFARATWDLLGLSPKQLVLAYTVVGAAAGGGIDAMVGGASMLAGAIIGTAVGAGAGLYHLNRRYATVSDKVRGIFRGWNSGKHFKIGPHAHANFPFILLDRALLHYHGVQTRAHARRDPHLFVPEERGPTARLPDASRRALTKIFTQIRKQHEAPPPHLKGQLRGFVREISES